MYPPDDASITANTATMSLRQHELQILTDRDAKEAIASVVDKEFMQSSNGQWVDSALLQVLHSAPALSTMANPSPYRR